MFFYKEYSNYIVNIHITEKIRFYTYKYYFTFKSILLLLKYIDLNYKVLKTLYEDSSLIRTNLYIYNYINTIFNFHSFNLNCLFFNTRLVTHVYNTMLYNFFILFFYGVFKCKLLMERKKRKPIYLFHNSNNIKHILLSFVNMSKSYRNVIFKDIVKHTSMLHIFFKTNTNNHYFNKMFLSHVFLNI